MNELIFPSLQQMRRSGNREENKRIIMDLDVVLKSHDCPYIVQCLGTIITSVSAGGHLKNFLKFMSYQNLNFVWNHIFQCMG